MEAEKFCVSLEAAKRLHEAGIMVDSYFHWAIISQKITFNPLYNEVYVLDHKTKEFWNANNNLGGNSIPAPTAEELWSILPHRIDVDRCSYRLKLYKLFDDDILAEYEFNYTTPYYVSEDNKLCETLAKLAIKLKEADCELTSDKG